MYTENRKATDNKFKVIGIDTFSHDDWSEGEFDYIEDAIKHAEDKVIDEEMMLMYVYDDKEKKIYQCGNY
jgi:hypothetical protein